MGKCDDCIFDCVGLRERVEELGHCEWFTDKRVYFKMPPCKIGDFVWAIRNYQGVPHAQQGKVIEMFFNSDMKLIIVVSHIARGEWGDKVFATKEEAEAKIKESK